MKRLSKHLNRLQKDESGAFLLLGLAAIMMIIMMTLAMIDTGTTTRAKLKTQIAADSAAYGASAIKARAMNQIVLANITKRSVVGILTGYDRTVEAIENIYLAIVAYGVAMTAAQQYSEAAKAVLAAKDLYSIQKNETGRSDGRSFKNNLRKGYKADLMALENIQRYFDTATPWWMYAHVATNANRNGMTAGSMYPLPAPGEGTDYSIAKNQMNEIEEALQNVSFGQELYHSLPIEKERSVGNYYDRFLDKEYLAQATMQVASHRSASDKNGKAFAILANPIVPSFTMGAVSISTNVDKVTVPKATGAAATSSYESSLSSLVRRFNVKLGKDSTNIAMPYELISIPKNRPYDWTLATRTHTLVYLEDEDISTKARSRYKILPREYSSENGLKYDPKGYWNVGTSEIFFREEGKPDMWHPNWAARLRPVAIGMEWNAGGGSLASAAADAAIYLPVSQQMVQSGGTIHIEDVKHLSQFLKGVGYETSLGFGK